MQNEKKSSGAGKFILGAALGALAGAIAGKFISSKDRADECECDGDCECDDCDCDEKCSCEQKKADEKKPETKAKKADK